MRIIDGDLAQVIKLNEEQIPLLSTLKNYSQKKITCFDVPGHVRDQGVEILNDYLGSEIMKMDINSSPFMDNVSNPKGIIKQAQDLLADAYKSDEAFFITNGTTQAIQAMILSVINPNEKVLLPRNIHKSVINALILSGGQPVFIQPEFDDKLGISLNISITKVKEALDENEDIKAIFLLNPTYYGACSNLGEIIRICRDKSVLVLVDEAHGAHFPFHKDLPPSAMELGADMAAVSIHKSGGALTQASVLLVNKKNIDSDKVSQSVNMLQSTSASYLLMSSIDGARYNLVSNGQEQLSKALNLSRYAKSKINKIEGIEVVTTEILESDGVEYIDETKLCINVKGLNLTGFKAYDILYQEFGVQLELGDLYNILALVSLGTTKQDIDDLIKSLETISKRYREHRSTKMFKIKQINPTVKLNPRQAFYSEKESIDLEKSRNKVCAESIMAYPPGIPIISPGELITSEILEYINLIRESKAYLTDMKDKSLETILVIKEN